MQNTVDLLKELFDYNQEANQKFIAFFQQNDFTAEKAVRLFSHILNAHHIWLARIQQQAPRYEVWQVQTVAVFEEINQENHSITASVLSSSPDFGRTIAYQNSSGNSFQNSIRDILLHVVNHSTYHRGQIASMIRAKGFDPPVTDYIFYQREKQ